MSKIFTLGLLLLMSNGWSEDLNRCITSDTTMKTHSIGPVIQVSERAGYFGLEYSLLVNSYSVFFNSTKPVKGHVFTALFSSSNEYHFAYGYEVIAGRYLSCLGRKEFDPMSRLALVYFLFVPGIEFGVDYSSQNQFGGHITGFLPFVVAYPFVTYRRYLRDGELAGGISIKVPVSTIFMP